MTASIKKLCSNLRTVLDLAQQSIVDVSDTNESEMSVAMLKQKVAVKNIYILLTELEK